MTRFWEDILLSVVTTFSTPNTSLAPAAVYSHSHSLSHVMCNSMCLCALWLLSLSLAGWLVIPITQHFHVNLSPWPAPLCCGPLRCGPLRCGPPLYCCCTAAVVARIMNVVQGRRRKKWIYSDRLKCNHQQMPLSTTTTTTITTTIIVVVFILRCPLTTTTTTVTVCIY